MTGSAFLLPAPLLPMSRRASLGGTVPPAFHPPAMVFET